MKLGHRRVSLLIRFHENSRIPSTSQQGFQRVAELNSTRQRLQREIANTRGITFDQLITRGISNDDDVVDDRYEARTSENKATGGTSGKRKYRRHPKVSTSPSCVYKSSGIESVLNVLSPTRMHRIELHPPM